MANRNEDTFRMAYAVEVTISKDTRQKNLHPRKSKKEKKYQKKMSKTRYLVSLRTSKSSRLFRKKKRKSTRVFIYDIIHIKPFIAVDVYIRLYRKGLFSNTDE